MSSKPTTPERYSVIGSRPARVDAVDKVTGRSIFGPDVHPPGLLYGKVLRSPHAHARIRSIDTSRAEALPGVYAVVTSADLLAGEDLTERLGEGYVNFKYLCDSNLASDKVLFVGHPVAAVAARDRHLAEEATRLIAVDYEVLPPVMDIEAAMKAGAPLLHETLKTQSLLGESDEPSNVASYGQQVLGDPDAAFAEAEVVAEREFKTLPVHQGYIEPNAATATWTVDGYLTIQCTTQGAFSVRRLLSRVLQQPQSKIKVIPTEIGGGFGGKNSSFVEIAAALLARKSGRPVKIEMSRAEVLLATAPAPGAVMRVKLGARQDGRLIAAEADLYYECGAYPGSPAGGGVGSIFAAYDIPNARADGYSVVVNKPQIGSYRAPQAPQVVFAMEQVIDELAEKLDMDPLDFRLLNSTKEGSRRIDGSLQARVGGIEVLEAARNSEHYNSPLEGPNRGRGVGYGFWGNWGAQSSCSLSVNADGTLNLLSGSVDVTGTRTSIAMQAAEVLQLPLSQIKPTMADTDSIGYTEISAGSRTTLATGMAAIEAAQSVLDQLHERLALLWDVPRETIAYRQGVFRTTDGESLEMTFADLAGQLPQTGGPVTGVGNVNLREWGAALGCHIADVEVDPETGQVTILRYTAIQDAGKAIHPGQVEGQMQGGATQGIGWALYEGYRYDADGRLLNPNLLDYKLPTALDLPSIETIIVEVPFSGHPFGVRGVGEIPIVPPGATLANAVYRACGVRIPELPMTPDVILRETGVL